MIDELKKVIKEKEEDIIKNHENFKKQITEANKNATNMSERLNLEDIKKRIEEE